MLLTPFSCDLTTYRDNVSEFTNIIEIVKYLSLEACSGAESNDAASHRVDYGRAVASNVGSLF